MAKVTADEVVTQKHKRAFIQYGGARPNAAVRYSGQNAQYMKIEGVTMSESGDVNPIYVPDPHRIGRYRLVGRTIEPPDMFEASIVMMEQHGGIPKQLTTIGCFNFYEATGRCKDLSDFGSGWSDYVLVYSGAIVGEKDLGDRMSWDEDAAIEDELSLTISDIYPVGALAFGAEGNGVTLTRAISDITFGAGAGDCSGCGVGEEAERLYAIHAGDGTATAAAVVYSVDGGQTWTSAAITGIAATEQPTAIRQIGSYLVVVSPTAPGYYVAELDEQGLPSAFQKVTAGFAVGSAPRAIYAAGASEVYFAAADGSVYRSTSLLAGVETLRGEEGTSEARAIGGYRETLVVANDEGVLLVSRNRGATWEVLADPTSDGELSALAVLDERRWWLGTDSGELYYTLNGGATWTAVALSDAGDGVKDILFVTDEVGYILVDGAARTRLMATWNGGATWTASAPRVTGLPVLPTLTRLAAPMGADAAVAANTLAIAGAAASGDLGRILLGVASSV